jgi:hypothetical protein
MVRYFWAWTPVVIVFGTAVILTIPYLALIVLLVVSLVALAALTRAIVSVAFMLSGAISRRWQGRSGASPGTAVAISPATSSARPTRSAAAGGATVLLANPPSDRDT